MKKSYLLIFLAVVLIFAGGWYLARDQNFSSQSNLTTEGNLPDLIAQAAPKIKEAYQFAQDTDVLDYISCYCGCGSKMHTPSHNSNKECFIKSKTEDKIEYDRHGLNCSTCVNIALDTKKLLSEGKPLKEVREAIDKEYSGFGQGTPTPKPK